MSTTATPRPPQDASARAESWLWDIFCRVIDNHGDLGVCWRLSVDLAERGHRVRLWVDDASALRWMAPAGHPGVQRLPWSETPLPPQATPGDVTIEAFGCELPASYQQALARLAQDRPGQPPVWLNLEYLSAETYVERSHGLPSPVMAGPAKGLVKWFFYPGFTPRTGGLIREPWAALPGSDAELLRAPPTPGDQITPQAPATTARPPAAPVRDGLRISLFCYEPSGLDGWLSGLCQSPRPTHLWVAAGRPQAAVQRSLPAGHRHGQSLNMRFLPYLTQSGYDRLLRHCDLNIVRGEDSLVRALWAGRPLIWHIYPQHDGAHHDKLDAFLSLTQAPASLADFHRRWNADHAQSLPALAPDLVHAWRTWALALRQRLRAQPDLTTQLIAFAAGKR